MALVAASSPSGCLEVPRPSPVILSSNPRSDGRQRPRSGRQSALGVHANMTRKEVGVLAVTILGVTIAGREILIIGVIVVGIILVGIFLAQRRPPQ